MSEPRRDNFGHYLVVPPGGRSQVGYPRVTTVAKALDDGGGLAPWKATATMVGALRRPGLHASWQALLAQHADPWYASAASKAECKKLVEQCATAGGARDRRDVGTALHKVVERGLRGLEVPLLQPQMQADLDAFRATVDAAGLIIDPDLIETCVVLDGPRVAGTADQLRVTVPGIGDVVGDLKTGADLTWNWPAICIQLAAYAHADAVYRQGAAEDGSEDVRSPMPELRTDVGLVIHLPAGEARCTLHLVDLEAGWHAFGLALEARAWRARRDLVKPLDLPAAGRPPQVPPLPAAGNQPSSGVEAPPSASPVEDDPPAAAGRPGGRKPARAEQLAQLDRNPDEGGPADEAAFGALEGRYRRLGEPARAAIGAITRESMHAGVSLHAAGRRTVRRFELIRGLVLLAEADSIDPDSVRAVAALVIGDAAWLPDVTTGHVVGSLDADRAARFARHAADLADGLMTATVADDGRISLRPAA